MNNIIVNADDFGYKTSVNKAIIELFERKLINSTTLMANMPGFGEAVHLAHQHKITNKIGAHLVLTEGDPLTEEIRSLPYLFKGKMIPRSTYIKKLSVLTGIHKKLIYKEYSKQIERIKKTGIEITHLDTHHQIHDIFGILQVLLSLVKDYKIPQIRILNNLENKSVLKNSYRYLINNYLKYNKVNYTDYFGGRIEFLSAIKQNSKFLRTHKVEIMVHPDYNSSGTLIDQIGQKEYDFDFLNPEAQINNRFHQLYS
jgi:chitin disaccharide deacetylase